jgi:hypothetical protein
LTTDAQKERERERENECVRIGVGERVSVCVCERERVGMELMESSDGVCANDEKFLHLVPIS